MSVAFSSLGSRLTVAVFSLLFVAGCSGSDRIPFADVGGPRAGDQLIGKVDRSKDGRVLVGRVGDPRAEAAAYAPPAGAANGGAQGLDYLNTPNLADGVAPQAAPALVAAEPQFGDGGERRTMSAMAIPEGGVNIDGALGIGAEPGISDVSYADVTSPVGVQPQLVTEAGAMAIAEGNTSQPVVDGIGFDEPTQIVTGPSRVQQPVMAETQVAEMPEEGGILPLSVDSGNSGIDDPAPVSSRRAAASSPARAAGAMAIAEGNTSQPVVDGIGFDEPTQIVTGPSAAQQPVIQEMQLAEMPEEGGILPLSVDNGNSGFDDPAPVSSRRAAAASKAGAPAGKDCSLYLDKRNCR